MPGGYRFALFGQRLDTTLFPQEFSYLAPERIVGVLRLFRRQHLAENPDQGFLDPVSYTHLDVYKRQQ